MSTHKILRLREWMASRDITLRALGEQLNLSTCGARRLLYQQTIPTARHAQLLALGFPPDLLPDPLDMPPGPKPKEPRFPGMARM